MRFVELGLDLGLELFAQGDDAVDLGLDLVVARADALDETILDRSRNLGGFDGANGSDGRSAVRLCIELLSRGGLRERRLNESAQGRERLGQFVDLLL